jgi:hypothetical protein
MVGIWVFRVQILVLNFLDIYLKKNKIDKIILPLWKKK